MFGRCSVGVCWSALVMFGHRWYLLAIAGPFWRFAVRVCRGGGSQLVRSQDKFVNCPRNISRVMRKHGTAESSAIKGSLGAGRQSKTHYTTAALCEKGWNEIKIVLFSRLQFTACGAVFIADL